MPNAIKTFIRDESGAVTIDWVVLTAALVGLGLAVMGVVSTGVQKNASDVGTSLSTSTPLDADGKAVLPF